MGKLGVVLSIGAACLCPMRQAGAEPATGGYVQIWWTVHEAVENGLRQAGSGDRAQQVASGFSVRRARVSLQDTLASSRFHYRVEALLEKSARLTDCFLAGRVSEGLELRVGQMKIPSTCEVMTPLGQRDFIQPSTVSLLTADWSLSRTPYIATFMGNRGYLRDVGVGLEARTGRLRSFAMVGNGLGANLFVGGDQHKEFVKTNSPGDWLYGLRLDAQVLGWLDLGGHGLVNRHDDMLFNDERTVIDLDRRTWSVDARARLPADLRLAGLYAGGVVDDDFYRDGKTNYEYVGRELKALHWLRPQQLETGLRWDRYEYEFNESGSPVTRSDWTLGLNYYWGGDAKVQVNYTWRDTDEAYLPDLDDNALLANLQFAL